MGQSLVKNYIHIVFSTKYREPLIHPPLESELHSYLAGICNNLECHPVIVGGYTDHIHILCMLSKKIALIKLVEKVKSHSSKWIKTKDESLVNFYFAGRNFVAARICILAEWVWCILCKSGGISYS